MNGLPIIRDHAYIFQGHTMRLTVNDFRQMNDYPGDRVGFNSNQQLTRDQKRCIRKGQALLHRTPIIRQLPCLRQQRLSQHALKSALLFAIAQEYGSTAVYSLNHYPNYWARHKTVSGRKINQLLQVVDNTYQPLGEPAALPRFITDGLLQRSTPTVATARPGRAGCLNRVVSRRSVDAQEERLQQQIEAFLLSEPARQTEARQQLHQALTEGADQ